MKTETHLKYAHYLKDKYLSICTTFDRYAFVLGCVEPDINIFSYLKGFRIKPFYGHNRENSAQYIAKTALKINLGEIGCFGLGRFVHFLCDAFTMPHNSGFTGGLREHTLYEKRLHRIIQNDYLDTEVGWFELVRSVGAWDLKSELSKLSDEYSESVSSEQSDARFIISATDSVMNAWVLGYENRVLAEKNRIPF